MDGDRLIAAARNPPNIVGIFNYCDRWCERCLFTDRCLQFQARSPLPDAPSEAKAIRHALEYFSSQLGLTFELLTRKMVQLGIPLPFEPEAAPFDAEEDAREHRVRNHRIIRAGHAYIDLVGAWFAAERDTLLGRAERLAAHVDATTDGEALVMEAAQVKNALQIIEHDRWFITMKLSRALYGCEWDAAYPDANRDAIQNDSNGSAKVALVSIDRSEASWRVLAEWLDSSTTAVLLAESLARLRTDVEVEFPHAREFLRPGFDHMSM